MVGGDVLDASVFAAVKSEESALQQATELGCVVSPVMQFFDADAQMLQGGGESAIFCGGFIKTCISAKKPPPCTGSGLPHECSFGEAGWLESPWRM